MKTMDSYVLIKTCNFCVQIFQNQIELKEHQNLVHRKNNKERSSICKDCDKTFTQKGNLERHIKLAHSKNLGEGTCDQCEKTFENRFRLTIHKYNKHREKTISCEYCPILTHQHDADLNKNTVCVEFKCNHCTQKLSLRSSNPGKRTNLYPLTAKIWKTSLERHMDEYHATLAQGLDIKKDWKSHYEMGTPFLEKRV